MADIWRAGWKWRVMIELSGADGAVCMHEVSAGGSTTIANSPATIGLTMTEGKRTPARDYSVIWFRHRPMIIAADGAGARFAGHNGPSGMCAAGGWCPCLPRSRCVPQASPPVVAS